MNYPTFNGQVITAEASRVKQLEKELADLKKNVTTVAQREAKKHNWCSVVDKALEEMGLGPKWVRGSIEVNVKLRVNCDVDENVYPNDQSETRESLRLEIENSLKIPKTFSAAGLKFAKTAQSVTVANVSLGDVDFEPYLPTEERPVDTDVPDGFQARFTSNDGRVRHYVPILRRGRLYAMCLKSSRDWSESSTRDEGRVCAECVRRAARL